MAFRKQQLHRPFLCHANLTLSHYFAYFYTFSFTIVTLQFEYVKSLVVGDAAEVAEAYGSCSSALREFGSGFGDEEILGGDPFNMFIFSSRRGAELSIYPSATASLFHLPCLFRLVMDTPESAKAVAALRRKLWVVYPSAVFLTWWRPTSPKPSRC